MSYNGCMNKRQVFIGCNCDNLTNCEKRNAIIQEMQKHYQLYVDPNYVLKYHFANGMIITTDPDWEYRHSINIDFSSPVYCIHIEVYDNEKLINVITVKSTKFEAGDGGWLDDMSLDYFSLLWGKNFGCNMINHTLR